MSKLTFEQIQAGLRDALAYVEGDTSRAVVTHYETHGTDTQERVGFYERDFYVLSNFSAFQIDQYGLIFMTSEHLYHWNRFRLAGTKLADKIAEMILRARSAHDAYTLAQEYKRHQVPNWDEIKLKVMEDILRTKVTQHEYVKKKLLATGTRELVEDSWRDNYWGSGPEGDGENHLGKLWMKIRDNLVRYGRV